MIFIFSLLYVLFMVKFKIDFYLNVYFGLLIHFCPFWRWNIFATFQMLLWDLISCPVWKLVSIRIVISVRYNSIEFNYKNGWKGNDCMCKWGEGGGLFSDVSYLNQINKFLFSFHWSFVWLLNTFVSILLLQNWDFPFDFIRLI